MQQVVLKKEMSDFEYVVPRLKINLYCIFLRRRRRRRRIRNCLKEQFQ